MKLIKGRSFILGVAVAAALGAACTSGQTHAPAGQGQQSDMTTGMIGMQLQLGPGITLSTVKVEIVSPSLSVDRIDTLDVSHSQKINFVIGGLAPATDYTVTLTATTDNGIPCTSGPVSFSIGAGETTAVAPNLVCTPAPVANFNDSGTLIVDASVTLGDAGPSCPVIGGVSAFPSEIDVGFSIPLKASVIGASSVGWSSAGPGTLNGASGLSNSLLCTGPGLVAVVATATAPGCGKSTASVELKCDAVSGGSSSSGGSSTSSSSSGGSSTSSSSSGGSSSSSSSGGGIKCPASCPPGTACNPAGTTGTCDAVTTLQYLNTVIDPTGACGMCAATNGCFDPAQQGGTCESLTGNATLLSGSLPDGTTCAADLGSPVTKTRVCFDSLSKVFTSHCAATLQETPCLCGMTDATACLAGTSAATGVLYDTYACDFGSASVPVIQPLFTNQAFGAGQANAIVQCMAAFNCPCPF